MKSAKAIMRRGTRSLITDQRGGVAVLTAMSLTGLMGFAGLGTEATMWYMNKRNMQGAADTAAFSAARSVAAGENSTNYAAAAYAVTNSYGFKNGTNGVTVAVNVGAQIQSAAYKNNANAIEVVISQPQTRLFSSLFLSSAPVISSTAVALNASSGGACTSSTCACVIALKTGSVLQEVAVSGSSALKLNGCNLDDNSSNADALDLSGGGSINASSVNVVGNKVVTGGSTITASNGVNTGAASTPDPYSGLTIPSYSGCTSPPTGLVVAGSKTLDPSLTGGVYVACGFGIKVGAGANLTLKPGVYVIDTNTATASGLNVTGSGIVTGNGVTIILTSDSGKYGNLNVSGTGTFNVTAPTTGSTAGVAVYQDRTAPSSGTNTISGNANTSITGALYFPSQAVNYSGGGTTSSSTCTQLIAGTLTFSGNTTFNSSGCSAAGAAGFSGGGAITTALVL